MTVEILLSEGTLSSLLLSISPATTSTALVPTPAQAAIAQAATARGGPGHVAAVVGGGKTKVVEGEVEAGLLQAGLDQLVQHHRDRLPPHRRHAGLSPARWTMTI